MQRLNEDWERKYGHPVWLEETFVDWVLAPTQTPPQEFGRAVQAQAIRRGMDKAKYVFVLADGAVWIWNIIEDRFMSCLKGLDFYHASTHLWAIAHELFPEEAKAKAWVEPLLHQLMHGQEADVLNTLEALPAQRQTAGLSLSDLHQRDIAHFQTHREHLHYQALAAKGSPIGTGAMESTCGQLQTRVKRTGQFWKPAGWPTCSPSRRMALRNCEQNPKSQRSAMRRLGARRRERRRTRSCCLKRIFSASTDRVPPVPKRITSLASRFTSNTIAVFMGEELVRH